MLQALNDTVIIKPKVNQFKKERISPFKGKHHTEEAKRKISFNKIGRSIFPNGRIFTEEHKRNISITKKGKSHRGFKHSEETKLKIKIARKKQIFSEETRNKMSMKAKGRKKTIEHRIKIGKSQFREKHWNWKGRITSLELLIRRLWENREWRNNILIRDNYTCQKCGNKEDIETHHNKKSFALIFQEFLQQYSQFSPIEDKETLVRLAITYKPFWDISNGITYCKECHKDSGRIKISYKH